MHLTKTNCFRVYIFFTDNFHLNCLWNEAYRKPNQLPYMNRELRKAMYNKKMFYNKYLKNKNSKTWDEYRKRRNLVNKLKKKSLNNYFQERCIDGCKSTDF